MGFDPEALEREKAMWEAKLRQLRGQTAGEPFVESSRGWVQ